MIRVDQGTEFVSRDLDVWGPSPAANHDGATSPPP